MEILPSSWILPQSSTGATISVCSKQHREPSFRFSNEQYASTAVHRPAPSRTPCNEKKSKRLAHMQNRFSERKTEVTPNKRWEKIAKISSTRFGNSSKQIEHGMAGNLECAARTTVNNDSNDSGTASVDNTLEKTLKEERQLLISAAKDVIATCHSAADAKQSTAAITIRPGTKKRDFSRQMPEKQMKRPQNKVCVTNSLKNNAADYVNKSADCRELKRKKCTSDSHQEKVIQSADDKAETLDFNFTEPAPAPSDFCTGADVACGTGEKQNKRQDSSTTTENEDSSVWVSGCNRCSFRNSANRMRSKNSRNAYSDTHRSVQGFSRNSSENQLNLTGSEQPFKKPYNYSLLLSKRAEITAAAVSEDATPATEQESQSTREALQRQIPKVLPFAGPLRRWTVSVALPASIIENAQTQELQAALVGNIARTLTIFGVDEVIIYEDVSAAVASSRRPDNYSKELSFFVRNLEYLDTPQYLRRKLFPLHPDLRYAGMQNSLDAPHHLRRSEWLPYREGVVIASANRAEAKAFADAADADETIGKTAGSVATGKKTIVPDPSKKPGSAPKSYAVRERGGEREKTFKEEKRQVSALVDESPSSDLFAEEAKKLKKDGGSWVECGLSRRVWIPEVLDVSSRVTVRLHASVRQQQRQQHHAGSDSLGETNFMKGTAVSPEDPPKEAGLFWGYRIRFVRHFKEVFTGCPYSSGGRYDMTIGTSERGTVVDREFSLPSFRHMLVVLGGLRGLEAVLRDQQSQYPPNTDPSSLFTFYINTCALQRSRTIRTEESIPITLALLRPYILANQV